MKLIFIASIFFSLLISPFGLYASSYPERPVAWVNDFADILSPAQEQDLNRKLSHFQDSTGTQIFIVTTNDHDGAPASLLAAEIGQTWGVGKRSEDNGLVILIYPEERDVFIATGYGVEQYITDAVSRRIIENEIIPAFRNNDYHGGLDSATDVIINLLSGTFTADQYSQGNEEGAAAIAFLIILTLTIILFVNMKKRKSYSVGKGIPFWVAMAMLSGSRRGSSGSFGNFSRGGGSFGGFSGGMGGRFGGGGAGGRW